MEIIKIKKSEIYKIKPLWEGLNRQHLENSSNFKHHFELFTFEQRVELLSGKDQVVIYAAQINSNLAGYCIASIEHDTGEIDSIFIQEVYRGKGVGRKLMQYALSWLETFECRSINVAVAAGNESVLPFYEKIGFRERVRVLQLKKDECGEHNE